jgi:hypothetical protein
MTDDLDADPDAAGAMQQCARDAAELIGTWLATTFALARDSAAYRQAAAVVRVCRSIRAFTAAQDAAPGELGEDEPAPGDERQAASASSKTAKSAKDLNTGHPEDEAAMQDAQPGAVPWDDFPRAEIESLSVGFTTEVWFTPTMHPKAKLKARKMTLQVSEDFTAVTWSYSSLRFKKDLRWTVNLANAAAVRLGLALGKRRGGLFTRSPNATRSVCIDGPYLPSQDDEADVVPVGKAEARGKVAAADFVIDGIATVLHVEAGSATTAAGRFAALAALVPFARANALPAPGTVGEAAITENKAMMRKPSVRGWWAGAAGDADE